MTVYGGCEVGATCYDAAERALTPAGTSASVWGSNRDGKESSAVEGHAGLKLHVLEHRLGSS